MAAGSPPGGDQLGQHRLGLGGGELAAGLQARRARRGARRSSDSAPVDGQVVLDVDEHPAGVAAGGDGGERELVEAALDDDGDAPSAASTPGGRRPARSRRAAGSSGQRGVDRARSTRRRARAARGRARGSTGSRRPPPSSAACACGRRPRPSGGSPGATARRPRAGRSGAGPRTRWPGRASAAS